MRNVVRGKRTCTADMCVVLDVQKENDSGLIDRKLIPYVLQKRYLLGVAESIEISPNGRFCSLRCTTTQIMSTFCTEPLTLSENNNIVFKPDYKPPQTNPVPRAILKKKLKNLFFASLLQRKNKLGSRLTSNKSFYFHLLLKRPPRNRGKQNDTLR